MLRKVAKGRRCYRGCWVGTATYCLALAALGTPAAIAQMPQDRPAVLPATPALGSPTGVAPGSSTPLGPLGGAPPVGSGQLVVDVIIRGEHTSKDYEIQ